MKVIVKLEDEAKQIFFSIGSITENGEIDHYLTLIFSQIVEILRFWTKLGSDNDRFLHIQLANLHQTLDLIFPLVSLTPV